MTVDQFLLAQAHARMADRLSGDIAGLFPGRREDLRRVAMQAVIDAAIEWNPKSSNLTFGGRRNLLTFEQWAGQRVRDALARYTEGWRADK